MIHLYCGDGKGKTTAAVGLAVRAAGKGKRVFVVRFMKTDDSGEVEVLKGIENITVYPCSQCYGFTFQMAENQREEARGYYSAVLENTIKNMELQFYDVIVMDEIMSVYNENFISQERFLICLREAPEDLEIILTGRNPSEELISLADYVTEMKKVKHPFDKGIGARKGIEY
ncbi:cob(I)yrinic acid a,c-diamide adenosyltransferase [Anaeromicropila populeti]|uniref:Cob(I)alamin adenosyltransferase n=1 Tax=Anaeromicropila populeti TaxID=37658 RepID=A0A1I6LBI9_9FIRM|nr:cob(I)yrinic acid a,c-diamide adenosyltransferase [Anaeromicropila populeti]SFS00833.1 cob(I)alamin adenosyltransferase [Anaeromicropila populeti]